MGTVCATQKPGGEEKGGASEKTPTVEKSGGGGGGAAGGDEKPRPQVFALMRNGHEVIRGAMRELDDALALTDDGAALDAFGPRWADFFKWQELHKAMEDGRSSVAKGMFAFLDEQFDSIAKDNKLDEKHRELHEAETAVADALQKRAATELRAAWSAFRDANEAHLKAEEGVMMPKVAELTKAGHNMPGTMRTHLLPAVSAEDMPFFISFAMKTLEKHHGDMPRARVFAHALAAAAGSAEQWQEWRTHVQKGLSPDAFAALGKQIDLDKWGDGAYPDPQPWMAAQ